MIARAADGSLRDALSLLDQAIAYCGGAVREEPVSVMLGTIDRQHVRRIVDLLADGDAAGLMATIAELDELFPDYSRLLDDLGRVLQQIAVFQVVGSAASDDDIDEADLARLATKIGAEDLQLYYQIAINGRRDLHLCPGSAQRRGDDAAPYARLQAGWRGRPGAGEAGEGDRPEIFGTRRYAQGAALR